MPLASFSAIDQLIFVGLYRLFPKVCDALAIVKPDTIVRWHRAGFKSYWRWKSRRRGGRPTVPSEICRLIREMSIVNLLWGAPQIHGELSPFRRSRGAPAASPLALPRATARGRVLFQFRATWD